MVAGVLESDAPHMQWLRRRYDGHTCSEKVQMRRDSGLGMDAYAKVLAAPMRPLISEDLYHLTLPFYCSFASKNCYLMPKFRQKVMNYRFLGNGEAKRDKKT